MANVDTLPQLKKHDTIEFFVFDGWSLILHHTNILHHNVSVHALMSTLSISEEQAQILIEETCQKLKNQVAHGFKKDMQTLHVKLSEYEIVTSVER